MALYGLDAKDPAAGAADALRGAREMLMRLDQLNRELGAELAQPLRMGIGIHFSEAIVGAMGPPKSQIITAIGDTVNTAARLESLTKDYDCALVVSQRAARSSRAGPWRIRSARMRGERPRRDGAILCAQVCAGTEGLKLACEITRLPLRAEPERLPASRPRALGADRFRDGARPRRAVPLAHRGHRCGALPAGVRAGDLRGSRLARHRLGTAGPPPVRESRCLPRCARETRSAGAGLSELREPRRDRAPHRAAHRRAVAARSRRVAALSRHVEAASARKNARGGSLRASPMRCGSTWTPRIKRTGALTWVEIGADPKQDHETLMAEPQMWGDVVLARKDTPTSYHLSVVVDDALQGVTHVVRGQDLYQATSVHRVLQALLELPPPLYHHHRLILDAEGHKLSKSTQATALRELRAAGRERPRTSAAWSGLRLPLPRHHPAHKPTSELALIGQWGPPVASCHAGWDVGCVKFGVRRPSSRGAKRARAVVPRPPMRSRPRSPCWRTKSARRSTAFWR